MIVGCWLSTVDCQLSTCLPGAGGNPAFPAFLPFRCWRCPAGGLPCYPPAPAAFSLTSCPPSPKGKDSPQPALAERSSRRHWLFLPRGRGPSQTPKFLSPGPPSPWLPALLIGKGFCPFCGEPRVPLCAWHLLGRLCKCRRRFNARGAGGGSPRRNKLKISPFPGGEGGWGDRGQEGKLKAGTASAAGGSSPLRHRNGRDSQCRRWLAAPPGTTVAGRASATGGKLPPSPFKNFSAAADIHILFTDIWYTQTRKTGGGMNPV